jgi:Protein of unknown function (DUF2690)
MPDFTAFQGRWGCKKQGEDMNLRRLGRGVTVLGAAAVLAFSYTTSAQAATFPHDGHQAYQDGCRADQQTIYHRTIMAGSTAIGYVDLMYSVNCHTAWAHVHSIYTVVNQTWVTHGTIRRINDGTSYRCTGDEGSQDCYTPMVYDKGMMSYATGEIDPNGATGADYSNQTPSY